MDLFVYGTTTGLWMSDTGNEIGSRLCLLSFVGVGGDNDNHDNQPKERRWEEE